MLNFKWRIEAAENSKNLVLGLWGTLAGVGLLLGIAATLRPKLASPAHGLMTLGAAGMVGMLLFPLVAPPPPGLQALTFLLASLMLAFLARIGGGRVRPVRTLLQLLALTLALDTVFHSGLAANSALSGFYVSGIRFYGIGNEYMGLLIGSVLMSVPKKILGRAGLATVLLLGLSFWGANAGGAMAATVAFFVANPPFPITGKWRGRLPVIGAGGMLAAILVAVLLAAIERLLPGDFQSHIGRAASGGPHLWSEIIIRKLAMNLRLAANPWTLLGVFGMVGALGLLNRGRAGERVRETLRRDDDLSSRVPAAGLGALAALIFNDSGIVAAVLLLAPVLFTVVERVLCDTSASISEPAASASRSATTT